MDVSSDLVALANLAIGAITALCATYLAFAALKHSAKPKIVVSLPLSAQHVCCNNDYVFVFEITNRGHWYGTPPALNIIVYCNFHSAFDLKELRYGSVQELSNTHVRSGTGGMRFIRAKGLKLVGRGSSERIHVYARTPKEEGVYGVNVAAFSDNGASLAQDFWVRCTEDQRADN